MSLTQVRDAIAAKIATVPGAGKVHRYERYAVAQKDFRNLYVTENKVCGWFVRRVRTVEQEDSTNANREIHSWRIEGVMSFDDANQSEIVFDDLIEQIRAAFRHDETIGGVVETTLVDGLAGVQLEDSGPVMFAGTLCHRARLSLQTRGFVDVGEIAIDSFNTGVHEWDLAAPDGTTDAKDTITLEQDQ